MRSKLQDVKKYIKSWNLHYYEIKKLNYAINHNYEIKVEIGSRDKIKVKNLHIKSW